MIFFVALQSISQYPSNPAETRKFSQNAIPLQINWPNTAVAGLCAQIEPFVGDSAARAEGNPSVEEINICDKFAQSIIADMPGENGESSLCVLEVFLLLHARSVALSVQPNHFVVQEFLVWECVVDRHDRG